MNQPNRKYKHLYTVVRIDLPVDAEFPENSLSIVKAFSAKETAEKEAERLSGVNKGKSSRYCMKITRFVCS